MSALRGGEEAGGIDVQSSPALAEYRTPRSVASHRAIAARIDRYPVDTVWLLREMIDLLRTMSLGQVKPVESLSALLPAGGARIDDRIIRRATNGEDLDIGAKKRILGRARGR
jgi:hypothetical protein